MATISQFVGDNEIQVFKDNVKKWRILRDETALALKAGLKPEITLEDIDAKIAATIRLIETYTNERYRE